MKLTTKLGIGLLSCALMATATGVGVQAATSVSSQNSIANHKNKNVTEPVISKISMVHYNVARVQLKTPISVTENYISITYGLDDINLNGSKPVYNAQGNYVAFDINLDEIAREGLNTKSVADSLKFTSVNLLNGGVERFSIENEELKDIIINAVDEGEMTSPGIVDINTVNNTKDYNKYLDTNIYGDHVLNGKLTTLSQAMQIGIKEGYTEGYHYKVTDSNGKEVQRTFVMDNNLFVSLENNTFNNEKYTLSVQKDGESNDTVLMTFTPFYIF